MKYIQLIVLAFFLNVHFGVSAQIIVKFDKDSILDGRQHPENGSYSVQKASVRAIEALLASVNSDSPHTRLITIVTSVTGCGGNIYGMDYVNEVAQRYGDTVSIIYILGDAQRDKDAYLKARRYLHPSIRLFSADEHFRKWLDDREGPDRLMKAVFPEEKKDVILTPKFHLYDPVRKQLLFHGGRFSRNTLPEDIVGYFMDRLRTQL